MITEEPQDGPSVTKRNTAEANLAPELPPYLPGTPEALTTPVLPPEHELEANVARDLTAPPQIHELDANVSNDLTTPSLPPEHNLNANVAENLTAPPFSPHELNAKVAEDLTMPPLPPKHGPNAPQPPPPPYQSTAEVSPLLPRHDLSTNAATAPTPKPTPITAGGSPSPVSPPSIPLPNTGPPISTCPPCTTQVVTSRGLSQYTTGASSSCIPSCLEASLQLLHGSPLSQSTLDITLKAGSRYRGASHIEASELQSSLSRYRGALELISEHHYPLTALPALVSDLVAEARRLDRPVAAVVTKPPESIMVAAHPNSGGMALFDSHPRPDVHPEGAAFVLFDEPPSLVAYLRHLFPGPREMGLGNLDAYTATILGSVSVLTFRGTAEKVETTLDERKLVTLEMQYDNFALQQENMRLSEQLESVKRESRHAAENLKTVIRKLKEELMAMRLQTQESDARKEGSSEQPKSGIKSRMVQMLRPSAESSQQRSPVERQQVGLLYEQQRDPSGLPRTPIQRPDWVSSYDSDLELAQQLSLKEQAREQLKRDQAVAMRLQEEFAVEESRLYSQPEASPRNIPKCSICGWHPAYNIFHIAECGHSICVACATRHVQTTMRTEGPFPCRCPCCKSSDIPQHMILSVLGEQDRVIWLNMERKRGIANYGEVVNCKNAKCGKPVGRADAKMSCPHCGHEWCEVCELNVWHAGMTCAQYLVWKVSNVNEKTNEVVSSGEFKKCPSTY
ncbi:hypothetical protein BC938DRAFT_481342 [Jimgerdemannia flammicorona]|uniref:RBR-type E3 ubiquitin transferase n=1 Tax=Jimgerdemannia flammicorona TaxID=994334 RepID=A0A433QGB6_9FUNG|nr:hypothetical protein BC938DRAFT_481342 [Jimgerdemannia flammicorona]